MEHSNHITDAAAAALCGDLSDLVAAYAARGVCGGCILRAAISHLAGVADANYGADLARDCLELAGNILEDVEAEAEPPGLH